jgi:phosphatidate cytidylyltransferase
VSNLAARVLTAIVAIPIIVGAIFWNQPWGVWAIVFIATGLGLREWMNMTLQGSPVAERAFGVVLGLLLSLQLYFRTSDGLGLALGLGFGVIVTFVFLLFRYGQIETVAARLGAIVTGALYVGVLLVFVALLKKRGGDGGGWILLTLTVVWFSDTGAYFAGRFLGPTFPKKLYEAMSPKKTLVGAIGGLCASMLAAVLAKLFYLPGLSWLDCALVAVPANLLGQVGDLAESMLKRSVGVKDSGALLPGHGGMLDRIDALLFAAPYIYAYTAYGYGAAR